MSIKVAINGFGRIGRPVLKRILAKHPNLKVVAINDLTDTKTLAHLLKYDSSYGIYATPLKFTDASLLVGDDSEDNKIKVFAEKDPINLPWKEMNVDIVLECTGYFTDFEGSKKHLEA